MTTRKKIRSNRHNAKRATGPNTAAGKARSRQNSIKTGVTMNAGSTDEVAILRLARCLTGDDVGPLQFEAALRAAKGHFEAERIRHHRIHLFKCAMADQNAYFQFAPPDRRSSYAAPTSFAKELRNGGLELLAERHFLFPDEELRNDLAYALLYAIDTIQTIDRYELRAAGSRNDALRVLKQMHEKGV